MARLLRREPAGLWPAEARRLWQLYRLALAEAGRPGGGPRADPELAALLLRASRRLLRPPGPSGAALRAALAEGVPRAVRAELRWVALAAGLYVALALAAGAAAAASPAWADRLLPAPVRSGLAASLAHGGAPAHAAAASLAVYIFLHNVAASVLAWAGGVALGLGAALELGVNAALVGALGGWMAAHGAPAAMWALLAPHGVLELPATFCAGGGGLAMGAAFLSPGERPRLGALFAAARRTAPLFAVCVAWLAAAAAVEGLFTPLGLPPSAKFGAAGALLLALVAYVAFAGRPARGSGPAARARRPGGPRPRRPPAAPSAPPAAERLDPAALRPSPSPFPRPLEPVRGRRPRPMVPPAAAPRSAGAPELAVRLPEGAVLRLEVAGVPARALAFLLDFLLLAVVFAVGGVGGLAATGPRGAARWLPVLAAAYALAALGLYWFLFEWLADGATPGKRALGLAVTGEDGRPPGGWRVLVRSLLRPVDALPACYLAGAVVALASGGSRRLGDWAAGTLVVHLPRPERPAAEARAFPAAPARRRPTGRPPLPQPHVRLLGPLPEARVLRRLPAAAVRAALRSWRSGGAGPAAERALAQAAELLPGYAGRGTWGPLAVEHLLAALVAAGRVPPRRFVPGTPRDRADDLGALAPGRGAVERVPTELAAAARAFWLRQSAMDGPARASAARRLAERLAAAVGAAELARQDPDALVEHVVHLLEQSEG